MDGSSARSRGVDDAFFRRSGGAADAHVEAGIRHARPRRCSAAQRRPAFRRSGMVEEPVLGFDQADLPHHDARLRGHGVFDTGSRRQGTAARGLLGQGAVQRVCADQLLLDQPRRAAEVRREPGRDPRAGAGAVHRGRARRRPAHGRPRAFSSGQEPRHHAGRGGVPQPPARGDSVQAAARPGPRDAGRAGGALDQQVLHTRPRSEEEPGALPARAGLHGLRHQLAQSAGRYGRGALRGLPDRRRGCDRRYGKIHLRRVARARRGLLPGRHHALDLHGVAQPALSQSG